jgi:hypothetical protein
MVLIDCSTALQFSPFASSNHGGVLFNHRLVSVFRMFFVIFVTRSLRSGQALRAFVLK